MTLDRDYETSRILWLQTEAHAEEDKLNISLQIQIIGANWYLYEELIDTFRLQKDVNVGMWVDEQVNR
jgi:hypothetical protein